MRFHRRVLSKNALEDAFTFSKESLEKNGNMYVLFIDGNKIKQVNDSHGHLAGDRAIETIANILAKNVRDSDRIIRFGGDEFVVFLNNFDPSKIRNFVIRIQKLVKDAPTLQSLGGVSISVGTLEYDGAKHSTLKLAIEAADKLMYAAKENAPYFNAFSWDNVVFLKKPDKRDDSRKAHRLRAYFKWCTDIILKEDPNICTMTLVRATREVWRIEMFKLLEEISVIDTLERIKDAYRIRKAG